MFVDMDRLKYINDNYGHEQGDIAIKIIASAILDNCPDSAIAVRNGGDEFIIIQDKISVEVYDEFVINMRKDIAHKIKDNGLEYDVSFSIGSVYTDMALIMKIMAIGIPAGIENGMFADWSVRAVIFIARFLSGKWLKVDDDKKIENI